MFCFVSITDELGTKQYCSNSRELVFYWLVVNYRTLSVCFDWTFVLPRRTFALQSPLYPLEAAQIWYCLKRFVPISLITPDIQMIQSYAGEPLLTCNCSAVATFSRYIHILPLIPSGNNLLDRSSTSRSIGGCSSFPNTSFFQALLFHVIFLSCFFFVCFVLFCFLSLSVHRSILLYQIVHLFFRVCVFFFSFLVLILLVCFSFILQ